MNRQRIIARKSPFVFFKLLIVTEFFFALLPFIVIWLVGLQESYDSLEVSQTVSYPILVTIILTTLQVLIVGIAFTTWYIPVYQIDQEQIVYQRGSLFGDMKLANTQSIVGIESHYGPLGKRLNYGNLVLRSANKEKMTQIKNIPNPENYAELIIGFVNARENTMLPPGPDSLMEVIHEGENQRVEFKSSLVWDYNRVMANKDLHVPVMKNLVAFMNTFGGVLLIGIGDNGDVLGLDPDLKTLKKPSTDGFENVFNQSFNQMIGVEYRQYVDISFPKIEDMIICRLFVRPSPDPAYLVFKGTEKFYIRAGNGAQPLSVSKATKYIQGHFET